MFKFEMFVVSRRYFSLWFPGLRLAGPFAFRVLFFGACVGEQPRPCMLYLMFQFGVYDLAVSQRVGSEPYERLTELCGR
jgi:hypothetical protein